MQIPNDAFLIIIGAMKSGTSTLYDLLKQHPQICPCITKEPEFFSLRQWHAVRAETYEELWPMFNSYHRYALEASTGYTKFPSEIDVAKRMFEYPIIPHFIYVVRDPYSRIESDYTWSMNKEWFNPNCPITAPRYVSLSMYFSQLREYLKYFPKNRITIIDFDALCSTPKKVLHDVYHSIGVADNFYPAKCDIVSNQTEIKGDKRLLSQDEQKEIKSLIVDDILHFEKEFNFNVRKWRIFNQ